LLKRCVGLLKFVYILFYSNVVCEEQRTWFSSFKPLTIILIFICQRYPIVFPLCAYFDLFELEFADFFCLWNLKFQFQDKRGDEKDLLCLVQKLNLFISKWVLNFQSKRFFNKWDVWKSFFYHVLSVKLLV